MGHVGTLFTKLVALLKSLAVAGKWPRLSLAQSVLEPLRLLLAALKKHVIADEGAVEFLIGDFVCRCFLWLPIVMRWCRCVE